MSRTFGIGDTGEDVSRWQQYLASQGFSVDVDGKFGPRTLAATRQMQRRMGLKPDGRVGQRTQGKQATPLPRIRPENPTPVAPMTPDMSGGFTPGQADPFISSGPEADLNAMNTAARNRSWDQQMAQQLMGNYYDAQKASRASEGPPAPFSPDFGQAGTAPDMTQVPQSLMQAAGTMPNFDWAGPAAGASVEPVPTVGDPLRRDAMIRALLGAGR